jgi:hypothetical protein
MQASRSADQFSLQQHVQLLAVPEQYIVGPFGRRLRRPECQDFWSTRLINGDVAGALDGVPRPERRSSPRRVDRKSPLAVGTTIPVLRHGRKIICRREPATTGRATPACGPRPATPP